MKFSLLKRFTRVGIISFTIVGLLLVLYSCSLDQFDSVQSTPGTSVTKVAVGAEGAKAWYDGLTSKPLSINSSGVTSAASTNSKYPLLLDWANASSVGTSSTSKQWLVPIQERTKHFTQGRYFGHRYLILQQDKGQFSGTIIELYSKKQDGQEGSIKIAKVILDEMQHGRMNPLDSFEGAAILYDVSYRYIQGRRYIRGHEPLLGEHIVIKRSGILRADFQSKMAITSSCDGGGGSCGSGCIEIHYTYDSEPYCDCSGGGGGGGGTTGGGTTGDGGTTGYSTTTGFTSTMGGYGTTGGTTGGPADPGDGGDGWGGTFPGWIPPGGTLPVDVPPGTVPGETYELQIFEQDYRAQMSPSELTIYDSMGRINQVIYLINAKNALNKAAQLYPTSTHNGNGDAFRHAYFVANNTRSLGSALAQQLAAAHEEMPGQWELEKQMDSSNNYAGLLIGLNAGDIEATVINWLNSGQLFIIEDNKVVPSHP